MFNPLEKNQKYMVFEYPKYFGYILKRANSHYSSLTKGVQGGFDL